MALPAAASRYARALFEAAREQDALDRVAADLRSLEAMVAEPQVAAWLADPRVESRRKQALLERALGGRLSTLTAGLLAVLGRRSRQALLPFLPRAFQDLLDRHQGRLRGTVESALPLDDEARRGLEAALSRATGLEVRLEPRHVPELLGGVRVTLGSTRYDGSVRGRLERVRRRLQTADLGAAASSDA